MWIQVSHAFSLTIHLNNHLRLLWWSLGVHVSSFSLFYLVNSFAYCASFQMWFVQNVLMSFGVKMCGGDWGWLSYAFVRRDAIVVTESNKLCSHWWDLLVLFRVNWFSNGDGGLMGLGLYLNKKKPKIPTSTRSQSAFRRAECCSSCNYCKM